MADPLTPPLNLVTSLRNSAPHGIRDAGVTREIWLINRAFAFGADQELEACCEWLAVESIEASQDLRTTRRPKPPSLKELALKALERMQDLYPHLRNEATIRRALNELPE